MRILTTATIALALGALPALAQGIPAQGLAAVDKNGDGVVTRDEMIATMDAAFVQLDTDRDGYLSAAEAEVTITSEQFAAADTNGDGRVSKEEFITVIVADFNDSDKNGDGVLN
ncbi:EF-hand domain-containing protein [Amaricoccus solimangrovi]|uniref:EF-hand domain-containing protein n=1 Tax=Amaricoccus solimangrovi TaxID=2589815 RepID=A0A501WHN4_9RHOB|nr:EF-hand domain-containing protein [Amaricoccus solimangrovi]TPE47945.1 EF-hand domain-containing protein [Amaricoccus solimangrovi]